MTDIRSIKIDEEFERRLYPLTSDEFDGLVASVIHEGFTDPIIVWTGHDILIDGHNRFRIWQKQMMEDSSRAPQIIERAFETRDDVRQYIIRRQLSRRNLTDAQKIEMALQLKPEVEKNAKENLRKAGAKSPPGKPSLILAKVIDPVDTRKELAAIAGVSQETFRRAEAVLNSGNEEAKTKMLAPKSAPKEDRMSINRAYEEVTGKPVDRPTEQKWVQGASSIGEVNETSPEDSESDGLFRMKQAWRGANKRDRKSFLEWVNTQ